jgi:alginate O-acetyltransferase complex protein AlgI
MQFNSLTFLLFFAIVMVVHYLPIRWRAKKINLLLASYLFYAAWNPPFVLLLWISTAVDWRVAAAISRTAEPTRRRTWLTVSLGVNLGLLAVFKYGDFLLDNFRVVLSWMAIEWSPPALDIVLPIGISFYTFQTLSYTLDVYFGRMRPANSLLDYAMYVTFFPQLVAGPIVRAREFLPQCVTERRVAWSEFGLGLALLTIGLFEKTVLADDILAPLVEAIYDQSVTPDSASAWIGTLAFSGQIFFDFAGYSCCAIGVAMCLGFVIPDNFRSPYAAVGFSDFWRRWHISLSSWLRDYLYIPLGGNRKGSRRTQANLLLTMLLGGLWHGASWLFVIWGGLHGLYLIAERLLRRISWLRGLLGRRAMRLPGGLLTFALVCVAWVFFRANDLASGLAIVAAMFGVNTGQDLIPATHLTGLALLTIGLMLMAHWLMRDRSLKDQLQVLPVWLKAPLLALMLAAVVLTPGENRAFIYFQF